MSAGKKKNDDDQPGRKVVCKNRRAWRDYFISDTFEAGLALQGSEVKSLRESRVNLGDSYAEIRGGELFLVGCHISEYPWANQFNHEPMRERKLLLHAIELKRLWIKTQRAGYTLVPLELYFNEQGRAKVLLGLGRGRRRPDKRQALKQAEADREMDRALRRGPRRVR